jgi:hypothetical protein
MLMAIFGLLLLPAASGSAAAAQNTQGGVIDLDGIQREFKRSGFLELACNVPSVQPMLTPLSKSQVPDRTRLIQLFFGGNEGVTATEDVISPIWGKGKRYKSSIIVNLSDKNNVGRRDMSGMLREVEVTPVYLDVYASGFVYVNNVPHKAVMETRLNNGKPSYHKLYSEKDGQAAAEALIKEMFGAIGAPAGFQESVRVQVQDYGEKLFHYYARPEYITKFNVTEVDAKGKLQVVGSQPVSVPVYDAKVAMTLDGEKQLCSLEFFWDGSLKASGTPKESISAFDAVLMAREGLLRYFDDEPPLLTVADIRIGFVHDRKDQRKLVPAWMFDAWYTETVDATKPAPAGAKRPQADVVEVAFPFAIDALNGQFIVLSSF